MLKVLTILLTFILLSSFQFAQDRNILRPDGKIIKHKGDLRTLEVQSVKERKAENKLIPIGSSRVSGSTLGGGTIDTLGYDLDNDSNFGLFGQDWLIQWFIAPADLNIQQVGFSVYANDGAQQVEVKVVKCNWTADEFFNAGITHWGYYQATGNGFNDASAFQSNPDITGGWTWIPSTPPSTEPFGADLWSDGGIGFPLEGVAQTEGSYQWVDLSILGYPALLLGEIFGIAVKNVATDPSQDANSIFRVGFWASSAATFPGWKYYAQYRLSPGEDFGWWSREFVWDFVAEVELTGDRAPVISDMTSLGTTLSTSEREVQANITDDNPSGSTPGGISSAALQWSIDDGTTWNDVAMSNVGGDTYSGMIPGQVQGTTVSYRISATDDNTNTSTILPLSYFVFAKQNDVLFIYNTGDYATATARRLYIGNLPNTNSFIVDPVNNDVWLSSDGTSEAAQVMSLYHWVVQIDGSFPDADFSDAVKAYLDGATSDDERNYFFSSQDYGCYITGNCADTTFAAGDFQYDYLGIETLGPQDLPGAIVGLAGVSGDPVSGWVDEYATTNSVGYYYDPTYELGFTSYIDALTPTSGATAIFTTDGQICGVRNEGSNWKTAFLAYDYAASDFRSDTSVVDHSDPGYAWGIQIENQALKFIEWAGYIVDVKPVSGIPFEYRLDQNYPNPFNPTTIIDFSVPKSSFVTLKVYDILGKEIKTLINKEMNSGNFKINFDATGLASGMYVYTLTAGDFTSSKKMVLLK